MSQQETQQEHSRGLEKQDSESAIPLQTPVKTDQDKDHGDQKKAEVDAEKAIEGSGEDITRTATGELTEMATQEKKTGSAERKVVKDSKWKAIFFMNLFALAATVQASLFKYVAKDGVSVIEFCFFRNLWIGGLAAFQMCYKKINPFKGFPKALIKDLIIRSMAGQITFALLNFSVTLIPMGTAMILMQTNPFWIAILACILLRERVLLIEIVGILVCFGGVIMIATSKANESKDSDEDKVDEKESSEFDNYLGIIVAFTGAWTFAVCSVFNRKLKAIDYSALMVYHGLIGGILAALFILIEAAIKSEFRIYSMFEYMMLIAASTWDTIACYSMTIAYQSDSSGFVSLLGYSIILFGFLSDVLVFDEDLVTLQLLGALLIFAATFVVAVFKLCQAHKERKKASLAQVGAVEGESKDQGETSRPLKIERQTTVGFRAKF